MENLHIVRHIFPEALHPMMHFDILVEHVPTPVDVETALDFQK